MSSNCRGDSSFFLSTVNVNELDRYTPDTVYLKHIISQWTQLQSKLYSVLHEEALGPGWQDVGIICITNHAPTGSLL